MASQPSPAPIFLWEKNWLEIFATMDTSIQFFNASEKGLNFEGIEIKNYLLLLISSRQTMILMDLSMQRLNSKRG